MCCSRALQALLTLLLDFDPTKIRKVPNQSDCLQPLLALFAQIKRYLARDAVLPSHQHVVSQAALGALTSLAADPAHPHHLADRWVHRVWDLGFVAC